MLYSHVTAGVRGSVQSCLFPFECEKKIISLCRIGGENQVAEGVAFLFL